ncbi:NADH-quinone oxidoreductase subunit N [Salsipaludibacter albus]|uniref:NADH-quinone oxidoreductase subunit N n=1 Tax=Salsipaludibacter albus TaxID=2849650 RepID=UPI001EE46593|nr:NADH-quinone oxidoreductase subunit N [Salsipaludibacter albus]MBY5161023.1 NADH-quinone oxidoreductase subunit N [Salsipaludibacter albus]
MAIDFGAIAPELVLTATAILVLMVDLVLTDQAKQLANPLSAIGALVALGFTLPLWGDERSTFGGSFVVNDYAVVFKVVFLVSLLAILGISWRYFAESRFFQGEYYFLLLVSFLGMLIMPSARDLLLLFIALETVSLPGFVMAGLRKRDLYSSEAAIKFFLIGVLSVALMLFGISMMYGFTGTTSLSGIAQALGQWGASPPPLLLASLLLIIVGFGFKISAVPFHFWAPDTYAGSPIPVAAMLAVASKTAGFAGLIAVTFIAFEPFAGVWAPALGVLAILTMTLGNLVAMQQRDMVRLLAWSSVAQAGYMLIPFGLAVTGNAEVNEAAVQATIFYIAAYAIPNIGAFGVVVAINRRTGYRSIEDFAGLGGRHPFMAVAMTTFLLSLGGAPPTVGLWAKFAIVQAGAESGTVLAYVLLFFLIVNSVIAFYYYLKVVWVMWMREGREGMAPVTPGVNLSLVTAALVFGTVLLFVLPGLIADTTVSTDLVAGL